MNLQAQEPHVQRPEVERSLQHLIPLESSDGRQGMQLPRGRAGAGLRHTAGKESLLGSSEGTG